MSTLMRTLEGAVGGPSRAAARAATHSRKQPGSRRRFTLVTAALAVALGCAVVAPASAEAQARTPKQRTRITAADRKAAADARQLKLEELKKRRAAGAAPANREGGAR